jgi:hypothetical protein
MLYTIETNPLIWGAGPLASSALGDTADWVCLKNAKGCWIYVTEIGSNATDLVLDHVHQGITNGTQGAIPALTTGQEFPIYYNLLTTTADTWTRATADALTYTIAHTAVAKMVAFFINADILSAGYSWIQLGSSGGHATNIVTVHYQIVGERYQQATPPTSIA